MGVQAQGAGSSKEEINAILMRLNQAKNQLTNPIPGSSPDYDLINFNRATGSDLFGAKNNDEMLSRLAAAFRRISLAQAENWGQRLGYSPAAVNLFRSPDFDKRHKALEQRSNVSEASIATARQLQRIMADLDQSTQNVKNSLLAAFGPGMVKELDAFSHWINAHGNDITGFFQGISAGAEKVTEALGGTDRALKDVVALYGASKIAKVAGSHSVIGKAGWAGALAYIGEPVIDKGLNALFGNYDAFQAARTAKTWGDFGHALIGETGGAHWEKGKWIDPRYQATPALTSAVARTESQGNPNAVSRAGAAGLMQLMPNTARDLGLTPAERFDPEKAYAAGQIHLSRLLRHYNGDTQLALMAYNAGQGRIDNYLAGKGQPLKQETLDYPQKVLENYHQIVQQASAPPAAIAAQTTDNRQTHSTHINTVNVMTHPQTVNQLQQSIEEQAKRHRMNTTLNNGMY
ncbi:lytic transglycosylase domain-containing protein [Candidatus Arsenophonus triatominarum]|uniref:lytic transglycosylase domain-containing protein n=1 Tax=Candidatus Arsenophonus triatominarum TaxID=57911 RepID=UPI0013969C27|nr:lytic transglycosylase domain-containing protein [Candidatus Arsenophonus triatominarum]